MDHGLLLRTRFDVTFLAFVLIIMGEGFLTCEIFEGGLDIAISG